MELEHSNGAFRVIKKYNEHHRYSNRVRRLEQLGSNPLPLYIYIMYWLVPRTSLPLKITNSEKLRLFNSFWAQNGLLARQCAKIRFDACLRPIRPIRPINQWQLIK